MPRSTRYSFTLNNYSANEVEHIEGLLDYKYLVYGKEIGSSGTPHLQGYIIMKRSYSLLAMKNFIPRAHFEVSLGNSEQNIKYCKKDGNYVEFGNPPAPGKRTDIQKLYKRVSEGASYDELVAESEGAAIRYKSAIHELISIRSRSERSKIIREHGIHALPSKEVYFFYGETGTGKTSSALQDNPDAHIQSGCRWFDGYTGQDTVIFDEFVPRAFPPEILLRLTDKYPMRVEIKGAFVEFNPKRIIFTTNLDPDSWFADFCPAHQRAMDRRITKKVHFKRLELD